MEKTHINKGLMLFILVIAFASCTNTYRSNISFNEEYTLKHQLYDTELMISIGRIKVVDTLLICISLQQMPFCKVYSIPSGMKEVGSYGSIGNGPQEFLQPLLTYSYDNTFGLNELNKNELAIIELNNEDGQLFIEEQKRLKGTYEQRKEEIPLRDYHYLRLDSAHYISLLRGGEGRFFSLLDSALMPIRRFGESPIPEELPVMASYSALNGCIAANNGVMAFATTQLPYLACYRMQSGEMYKQWSFFYDQPHYGVRNEELLFDKEKSFGKVLNLEMDDRYIYVLYLDQLLSEYDYNKIEKSCANKVLVFDHEGNAVAKLHLDCRIYEMTVSGDRTKLFGIAPLPDPALVAFDLPEELKKQKGFID